MVIDGVKICSVDGCNEKHRAKGYCKYHYSSIYMKSKKCSVDGCEKGQHSNGLCVKHYKHIYRHEKIIERTKYDKNEFIYYDDYAEIIIYNRESIEICRVLVDVDDVEKCQKYKWHLTNKYPCASINESEKRHEIKMHRLILGLKDKNILGDHINGNILDNRKSNLRVCDASQNATNKSFSKLNTSGVTGVTYNSMSGKWSVQIYRKNKKIHIGLFKEFDDAVNARKKAEAEYYGEYVRGV